MFLLKRKKRKKIGKGEQRFTFHNVSIKTSAGISTFPFVICFTFHNVSIKTFLQESSVNFFFFFTFHNVSIKTGEKDDELLQILTLHSTMFLLKPAGTALAE